MVEIIDNPTVMSSEEMKARFDGKWIYVVNCEFTQGGRIVSGIPVVVADMQFEDVDSGIYDKYDAEEFGRKLSKSYRHSLSLLKSISLG